MFLIGLSLTSPPSPPHQDKLESLILSVSALGNTDLILNFLSVGLATFFVKLIAPLCHGFSMHSQNTIEFNLLLLSVSIALTHFTASCSETHFTLGFHDTTFSLISSFPAAHLSFHDPSWLMVLLNLCSSWPISTHRYGIEPSSLSKLSLGDRLQPYSFKYHLLPNDPQITISRPEFFNEF